MEMTGINESVIESVREIVDKKVLTQLSSLPKWRCFLVFKDQTIEGISYVYIYRLSEAIGKTVRQLTYLDVSIEKYQDLVISQVIGESIIDESCIEKYWVDTKGSYLPVFNDLLIDLAQYLFIVSGVSSSIRCKIPDRRKYENIIISELESFIEEVFNESHTTTTKNIVVKLWIYIPIYSRKVKNRLERGELE